MRTVVFLGKRTSRDNPLKHYPGATLWGTTHSNQRYARYFGTVDNWHAWWDLHPFNEVPGYAGMRNRRPDTYRWYQTLPGPSSPKYRPLYLAELDPSIPAGVVYNYRADLAALKMHPQAANWITCQVDLMMIAAMAQGFEHIVLHGHGTKREVNHMIDHVGVIVWIALARARGITVTILEPSWYVGQAKPYGVSLDGWTPLRPGKVTTMRGRR